MGRQPFAFCDLLTPTLPGKVDNRPLGEATVCILRSGNPNFTGQSLWPASGGGYRFHSGICKPRFYWAKLVTNRFRSAICIPPLYRAKLVTDPWGSHCLQPAIRKPQFYYANFAARPWGRQPFAFWDLQTPILPGKFACDDAFRTHHGTFKNARGHILIRKCNFPNSFLINKRTFAIRFKF